MATINEVRQLLYNTFNTSWANETPIAFDNDEFNPPSTDTPWVRLVVRNRVSNQETLGPVTLRKFLRSGSVFVQVFVPINVGLAEADRLARLARNIFEGTRLSRALWINNVDVRESGPEDDWYQILVEGFFTYEETK